MQHITATLPCDRFFIKEMNIEKKRYLLSICKVRNWKYNWGLCSLNVTFGVTVDGLDKETFFTAKIEPSLFDADKQL